jgi:hypothetical protein
MSGLKSGGGEEDDDEPRPSLARGRPPYKPLRKVLISAGDWTCSSMSPEANWS